MPWFWAPKVPFRSVRSSATAFPHRFLEHPSPIGQNQAPKSDRLLDCALCYGWIDGQKAKYDDKSWVQYFTKRKKKSLWSQVNQKNVDRLIAEGRMRSPGLDAIAEAKLSGQWHSAYQPTRSRDIPEDLEKALKENPKAKEFFESLGSQNRFAFVFRLTTAKKAETRLKRLTEYLQMMERGEVFHPKKQTGSGSGPEVTG